MYQNEYTQNVNTNTYRLCDIKASAVQTKIIPSSTTEQANMYTKVIVVLCAAGIASAGNLLHAAPVAYSSPVSSVSYSSQTTAHAAPVAYAAAPVVAKTISPAVSYQTISTHSAPALAAYSAPAVAAYHAPLVTKTIAAPVSYSSVAHPAVSYSSVAHAAPVAYSSPVYAKTIAAPVATYAAAAPAYSTYAAAPVLKSAITYSAAPAVSHVSYTGLGATYGW
ncbi:pupal cuticle protein C1B [Bicyclus anynana]|uniref:Pupal cuticle protein C1B n=1 Tax=Bicyclus anynana TaxID=110368 RepID=A0A6J1N146_BICAN|nr:pupal cuticle protein C1B [Bicyclus anynana]